jgi:hypothetical protein
MIFVYVVDSHGVFTVRTVDRITIIHTQRKIESQEQIKPLRRSMFIVVAGVLLSSMMMNGRSGAPHQI